MNDSRIIHITNDAITNGEGGPPFTQEDDSYMWGLAMTLQSSINIFSRVTKRDIGVESTVAIKMWRNGLTHMKLNDEWVHCMDPSSASRVMGQIVQHIHAFSRKGK